MSTTLLAPGLADPSHDAQRLFLVGDGEGAAGG